MSTDAAIVENRVGEALAKTSYHKTLYENTITSNGSDAPVKCQMPLLVLNLPLQGNGMHQERKQTWNEQGDSYTIKGAEQLFMQDRINGKVHQITMQILLY